MNDFLLAAPAFLPILGGVAILASRVEARDGKAYRNLEYFVEGFVIVNSLMIAWLIGRQSELRQGLVLFRLYADLKVMFKLDKMGSVFAGLVAFLWPLATLYSFEYMRREERRASFFAFYLMTYGVTVGIAFAGNLVTMYLFYEVLTLVTFPLVLFPMTKEAVRASRTYLYFSIGGAAFAFIGLIFVLNFSVTGNTEFLPGGSLDLTAAGSSRTILLFVYVLAFFGFGVKAAVFPCHGWLPKATAAPTPVTALLHAVAVVKSGAFAILRFTYFCFGTEFLRGTWAQWIVMGTAMVTIAYGSTMAVKETHWKRRLAYSTISNLSYILLGASMMSPLGLTAAVTHLVFHAFMKICSFFCAGAVMHQTGKTYVWELDGLGKHMPVTFACLTIASLSLMGIPLFAGFISKWNIALAALECGEHAGAARGWFCYVGVAVILYSALMTGIYMMTVLVRAYFPAMIGCPLPVCPAENDEKQHGAPKKDAKVTDPNCMMLAPLLIFAMVIVALGVHSAPLMRILTAIGGEAG